MWIWTDDYELVNTSHVVRAFLASKNGQQDGPWDVRAEPLGGRNVVIEKAETNDAATETLKYLGQLLEARDPING